MTFCRQTALVIVLGLGSIASGATWYVSTDGTPGGDGTSWATAFDTIQAGIDAGTNGDVVEIADGTYTGVGNKDLDFQGKAITIRSESGDSEQCIIDCEHSGRGFVLQTNEGPDTIITGLTICNGYVNDDGGGIKCVNSSPTIENCILNSNNANSEDAWKGGGIYASGGSPAILNCVFSGNSASDGGGLFLGNLDMDLSGCRFLENSGDGGGAYLYYCDVNMADCFFLGNNAITHGGGICTHSSALSVTDSVLEHGRADYGAGIYNSGTDLTILSSRFNHNQARWYGGAIYSGSSSDLLIHNGIFQANEATLGAGVYDYLGVSKLTNCTFTDNKARSKGGGVYSRTYYMTITNCIIWGDSPDEIYAHGSSYEPAVSDCDIQGGWDGVSVRDADPLFASPEDLHLLPDSICIDDGTNSPVGGLPEYDFDGLNRILEGGYYGHYIVDIGAYEFDYDADPVPVLYPGEIQFIGNVNDACPEEQILLVRNRNNGTVHWTVSGQPGWLTVSPESGASNTESDEIMLSVDCAGLEPGVYSALLEVTSQEATIPVEVNVTLSLGHQISVPADYPTIQEAIDAAIPGDEVIVSDGVYAGQGNRDISFKGKPVTVRSQNGPHACFIDCQGGYEEPHRAFVFDCNEQDRSVLRGFTIRNGFHDNGGAVYCFGAAPAIQQCIISENRADSGAGLFCETASPTVTNCLFYSNDVSYKGGGAYLSRGSTVSFVNCTLVENRSMYRGSAICSDNSSDVEISNCIAWGITTQGIPLALSADSVVRSSDIQGGWEGGTNIIDEDPLYAFQAGDFHLLEGSPCINAGSNGFITSTENTDLDGNQRVIDTFVDLGAFEFDATVLENLVLSDYWVNIVDPYGEKPAGIATVEMKNRSSQTILWEAIPSTSWLNVSPNTGACANQPQTLTITANTELLSPGLHRAFVNVVNPNDSAVLVTLHVEVIAGGQILVNPDGSGDYDTIQEAIDAALPGDRVLCMPGVYAGEGNTVLDFRGKAIELLGQKGAQETIISCAAASWGIYIRHEETPETIIDGFTISGLESYGSAIRCYNSRPTIQNCILKDNISYGGQPRPGAFPPPAGIFQIESSAPVVNNMLLCDNTVSDYGCGGMYLTGGSNPLLQNCSIIGNEAAGIVVLNGSAATLVNCIAWDNTVDGTPLQISANNSATVNVRWSCILGSWPGEGNIDEDPLFVGQDDYRLTSASPCIDTGTNGLPAELPELDLDGMTRLVDGDLNTNPVIDMGAYEYQAPMAGDLDQDADVDLDDYVIFFGCLTVPGDLKIVDVESDLPDECPFADFNLDGDVDLEDFAVFQQCFEGTE